MMIIGVDYHPSFQAVGVTREESATISQTQRIIPEWAALATPYHASLRCGSMRLRRQVLFKVA